MSKIIVAYWSQTGNTEAMANAVGEGIKAAGGEADVVPVSAVSVDELKAASSFALGCPAMGAEVLEESEMEPFVEEVEGFAAGKKIALFGSYGWGDGQWMRDWEERMNAAGATVVNGEGVISSANAPVFSKSGLLYSSVLNLKSSMFHFVLSSCISICYWSLTITDFYSALSFLSFAMFSVICSFTSLSVFFSFL